MKEFSDAMLLAEGYDENYYQMYAAAQAVINKSKCISIKAGPGQGKGLMATFITMYERKKNLHNSFRRNPL